MPEEEEVEETNSGMKKKGDWQEVAEFGEELEEAMEESEIDGDSVERFHDWRPKQSEAENDMKQKTVDEATVDRKTVEEKDHGVKEGFKEAGEKVAEAGKKAANGEASEKEVVEASEDVATPFISKLVKLFRKFESVVYSKFSLRGRRYYLDTDEFSVDMKSGKEKYEMDLNVPTESPRRELREEMED